MAEQRGGLSLLSLISLAVLHLTLGTTTTDVTATVSPTVPTSPIPMDASALLPTTDSTTAVTLSPSSPETGASTLGMSSISLRTSSASPPTAPPPTAPAPTDASAKPSTTLADTTVTPFISMGNPGSNPAPSQLARTMSGTTPGISTLTMGPTPCTPRISGTPSTTVDMETSSHTTNSPQTPEVTPSTTDLPTTLPSCPSAASNTSASYLFLSLRLTVPLNLENTVVQELVMSKLRRDLQTEFPCAGLEVQWRGKRKA
ncbi:uncharacterized protein O9250_005758 [Rhynochetos jubatus]